MWVLVTLKENIKKILEDLSIGKNISDVFSDVIICSAYSLANLSCFNQERENQYNYIIGKYGKDKEKQVASILVMLLKAYSRNKNQDILGEIYEKENFRFFPCNGNRRSRKSFAGFAQLY